MPPSKEELKTKFINHVSYLLQINNFKGDALCKFLRHHANRFNNGHVDVHEVLVEGVKRGVEYIEKTGQEIQSPEAWLRVTCLNVLRDKVKDVIREEKKVQRIQLFKHLNSTAPSKPELVEQIEYLDLAMQELSTEDQELICLRFFKHMKYQEVQYYYSLRDGVEISLSALRKRESRALKRLKIQFVSLYEGVSI